MLSNQPKLPKIPTKKIFKGRTRLCFFIFRWHPCHPFVNYLCVNMLHTVNGRLPFLSSQILTFNYGKISVIMFHGCIYLKINHLPVKISMFHG